MFRLSNKGVLAALLLCLPGCSASPGQEQSQVDSTVVRPSEELGLFATLPIYWGEGGDIAGMLDENAEPGWVRMALEERGKLVPLDTLEPEALDGMTRVILAQPRPLAPSENVSFDTWLREGGAALIFADPMLTQHSDYPLGDPRRPHDMAVISPILARWGLELVFDEAQPEGEKLAKSAELSLPVDLHGRFETLNEPAHAQCALSDDRLIADCRIGTGRAVIVADAALLDDHHRDASRKNALYALMDMAFPE